VLAKRQPGRAATGERQALHFEKLTRCSGRIRGLVPELFDQIEKDIRRAQLQFFAEANQHHHR